jgi:hypothetical protein
MQLHQPILFGSERCQRLLLEAYEHGATPNNQNDRLLYGSGLAYRFKRAGRVYAALDERHPCFPLVLSVLAKLSGKARGTPPDEKPEEPHVIRWERPLCHFGKHAFRLVHRIAEAGPRGIAERVYTKKAKNADGTAVEKVRFVEPAMHVLGRRLPDVWCQEIRKLFDLLAGDGVVSESPSGELKLARGLPADFPKLVLAIGEHLAKSEARFGNVESSMRTSAVQRGADDAPTVFGTDIRMRVLTALAKHGPMHGSDLRRTVGGDQVRPESYDYAMQSRGGLVEVWDSGDGGLVYGLHRGLTYLAQLRELLLALERAHPLPPAVRQRATPPSPAHAPKWNGDRYALFGTPLRTVILLTSGVHGWTYQSLMLKCLPGYYREAAKRSVHRLEDIGLLQGSRERRGGFDLRALTISKDFAAKPELEALIRAAVDAWPALKSEIRAHFRSLKPKTIAHLKNKRLFVPAMLEPDPTYFGGTWSVPNVERTSQGNPNFKGGKSPKAQAEPSESRDVRASAQNPEHDAA